MKPEPNNPSAAMLQFDAAIEQRMRDPLWDERMSRDVVRRSERGFSPGRLARNRLSLSAGMAAAIILVAGASLFYIGPQTGPTQTTPPVAASDPGGTLDMGTANPADLDAFPYRDEGDISMVLDDLYGE